MTSYCGDTSREHRIKTCPACSAYRREELSRSERTCPSCRMRWRVPAPKARDYNPRLVDPAFVRFLENAAQTFDEDSDQRFTAQEFIAWLKPDLTGRHMLPEFEGLTTGSRYSDSHISDAFPLPQSSDGVRRTRGRAA